MHIGAHAKHAFADFFRTTLACLFIVVTSHDRVVGGYLSASELEHYEKLKARERQVLMVGALSDDIIADIEAAEYGIEAP